MSIKKNIKQAPETTEGGLFNSANRRDFVKSTAALGVGYWVAGGTQLKASTSKMEKVQFGCIGIGGKGSSDSADANRLGKVVAACDVDEDRLAEASTKFAGAAKFFDYRKMLDEMGDKIDAVTVSTPDHTHAVAALAAMRMGKHCFCQKPLTHSIEEARMMGDVAKEKGIVTQMGNQGTANSNLRLSAAMIRAGVVGRVKEVHVWTNRPVWPQSNNLVVGTEPNSEMNEEQKAEWLRKKKAVHWKEWIGPAEMRDYSPEIHPFKWRGFWAFGTGALGDMACHTLNMSYMALDLKFPTSVTSVNPEHDRICYPKSSTIAFEFPELNGRAPVKMFWYDGGDRPPAELLKNLPKNAEGKQFTSGALIVGEKGNFYSPSDYGEVPRATGVIVDGKFTSQRRIYRGRAGDEFNAFKDLDYPVSPGHFEEFINGINGDGVPVSNFPEYAGPLTETILLGNLAVWSGKKVEWDAKSMIAKDADEAVQKMIRHEYKNGYTIHV